MPVKSVIAECKFERKKMLRNGRRASVKRKKKKKTAINQALTEIVRLCRAVPGSHPVGADRRPAPHAAERLVESRATASPREQGEAGARGEHVVWEKERAHVKED